MGIYIFNIHSVQSSIILIDLIPIFIFRLQTIHEKNFIHRDFHSGNILIDSDQEWKIDQYLIGDLGLSQSINHTLSNNEIYGVIPYIAPEIFNGVAFSKESDIYIMV